MYFNNYCNYFLVRPTVIETAVYVNSIGPVDPINMVSNNKKALNTPDNRNLLVWIYS